MSSILSSQGMAFATAMAVSAGTVILLALRLQRLPPVPLRSCISSEGKKKKKKRVHFAADVMDPRGDGEEFRRRLKIRNQASGSRNRSCSSEASKSFQRTGGNRGMPENRAVLYNGILRDRAVHHRFAAYYSR